MPRNQLRLKAIGLGSPGGGRGAVKWRFEPFVFLKAFVLRYKNQPTNRKHLSIEKRLGLMVPVQRFWGLISHKCDVVQEEAGTSRSV